MSQSRDRQEETKRMIALACRARPKVEEPLGSNVLTAALAAKRLAGRRLGSNEMVEVALPVFVATGNDVVVKGDLSGRVLPIDLDAGMPAPWARERAEGRSRRLVAERQRDGH